MRNADLSYSKCRPIILSAKYNITKLLVTQVHEKYFHYAKNVIYPHFQSVYWFVGGIDNFTKEVIRDCILCKRLKAVAGAQLMGKLPAYRVSISRPCTHTGVDFTGHC